MLLSADDSSSLDEGTYGWSGVSKLLGVGAGVPQTPSVSGAGFTLLAASGLRHGRQDNNQEDC